MHLLEMALRKKLEATKDLPLVKVILKKFKEKDEYFNPKKYLGERMKKNIFNCCKIGKSILKKNI